MNTFEALKKQQTKKKDYLIDASHFGHFEASKCIDDTLVSVQEVRSFEDAMASEFPGMRARIRLRRIFWHSS